MKKIRLILLTVFTVVIICALALTAEAKWWDDNPFTDVKSDGWYYDSVRICKELSILNGVGDTVFGVNDGMTRAMFVTTLASASGFDASEYTENSFSDVPSGAWYAAPAAWAYENGVTGGAGDGIFSPDAKITRAELVTMLRKYAALAGYDTDAGDTSLDGYADIGEVPEWAKEALVWAVDKGIISGMASGEDMLLAPNAAATRAQAATMIVKLLYMKPVREINGSDLSLYRIVYSTSAKNKQKDNAEQLAWYIKKSFGLELPILTDDEEPTEYEILVGKTNREDKGLVSVDLSVLDDDQKFLCQVQGSRLIIQGFDTNADDSTHENKTFNVKGTRNAVFYFAQNVLGVGIYSTSDNEKYFGPEGGIYEFEPDPIISLEDGWTYVDGPYFRSRVFYMSGGILGTGKYQSGDIMSLSAWIEGEGADENDLIHNSNPCLSDEDNVNAIIENVKIALAKHPEYSYIGIDLNDSDKHCQCKDCLAAYRKYQSHGATLMLLVNRVAEATAEEFPDVKIKTDAYTFSITPPVGITMNERVIIEFFTIESCGSHAYTDKSCMMNAYLEKYIEDWKSISSELWIWDHCCAFVYSMTPMPDWDVILPNVRFFADSGARDILMNSLLDSGYRYSDFGYLRGYALSMVYRDPYMSEEEYWYRMDKAIEAYYGPGWRNIREYIDIICTLGKSRDHKWHASPGGFFDFREVRGYSDHIDELWANAKAAAAGDEMRLRRIVLSEHSWIYLRQCALYQPMFVEGTTAQREAYEAVNQELYDSIMANNISWTEGSLNELTHFSTTTPPSKW